MIAERPSPRSSSTRDRLLIEALRLFAARGFSATTVGAIEEAAGLRPRRGSLYKHFASKEALFEEAVHRHLSSVHTERDQLLRQPLGDVRAEALQLGQFVLAELLAQRALLDVLERDADRIPSLRSFFRDRLGDPSYRAMAFVLHRWAGDQAPPPDELLAEGVLLLGGLINVHRATHTLGGAPLGLEENTMIEAWADECVAVAQRLGDHEDG